MRHIYRTLSLLFAAVLLLSSAAFGSFAAAEEPTREAPEVPVLDDLPDIDVHSWEFLLANSYNSIGWEYELPSYGGFYGQGIDARISDAAVALLGAAREAGFTVYVSVAFRNGEYLFHHYQNAIKAYGSAEEASKHFLASGCNDHHTGLAIDITINPAYQALYDEFTDEETLEDPVYDWFVEHCAEYGFILRYPEGKEAWYGTPCSHAHFRYVGEEAAAYITEHDLCLEEFLYLEDPSCLFVPGLNSYASF